MAFNHSDITFLKRRAITSYGIILFTMDNNPVKSQILYQLIQRRDSISYSEFLQDRLPPDKIEMHIKYLMSKEEKQRCLEFYNKKDPESLWNDLWINHKSHIYKNNMEKYIGLFQDQESCRKENSYGFPKGRKHVTEDALNCALREFEEEVLISRDDIQVLDIGPFDEYYIGTDGRGYRTICYVAYIPFIPEIKSRYPANNVRNSYISEEVSQIKWLPFLDSLNKLEDNYGKECQAGESNKKLLTKVNRNLLFRRRRRRSRRATF